MERRELYRGGPRSAGTATNTVIVEDLIYMIYMKHCNTWQQQAQSFFGKRRFNEKFDI